METTQIDKIVEKLLIEVLQIPASKISDELTMMDIEVWDSLKHMEFISSLEESFNLSLTFDEIIAMQNVSKIKHVLYGRVAS